MEKPPSQPLPCPALPPHPTLFPYCLPVPPPPGCPPSKRAPDFGGETRLRWGSRGSLIKALTNAGLGGVPEMTWQSQPKGPAWTLLKSSTHKVPGRSAASPSHQRHPHQNLIRSRPLALSRSCLPSSSLNLSLGHPCLPSPSIHVPPEPGVLATLCRPQSLPSPASTF